MADESKGWALILGASSGFGGATARELSRNGFNIFGVHLDMRSTLPNAVAIQDDIKAQGHKAIFFNMNAADEGKRKAAVATMVEETQKDGSFVRQWLETPTRRRRSSKSTGRACGGPPTRSWDDLTRQKRSRRTRS